MAVNPQDLIVMEIRNLFNDLKAKQDRLETWYDHSDTIHDKTRLSNRLYEVRKMIEKIERIYKNAGVRI